MGDCKKTACCLSRSTRLAAFLELDYLRFFDYLRLSKLVIRITQTSHPGLRYALMFVAPDDQVQKTGQVLRLDGIFGAIAMLHTILVQNENVEPF